MSKNKEKIKKYNRTIFLMSEIEADVAGKLITRLFQLDSYGDDDINLLLNSPGGGVTDCFAVYDTIQAIESKVNTICFGMANSAAAILLAAGTGKRYASRNSEIMIHEPSMIVGGKSSDLQSQSDQINRMNRQMAEILEKHTKKSYNDILKDIKKDMFLNTDEALEYGIIDEIGVPKNIDMEGATLLDYGIDLIFEEEEEE